MSDRRAKQMRSLFQAACETSKQEASKWYAVQVMHQHKRSHDVAVGWLGSRQVHCPRRAQECSQRVPQERHVGVPSRDPRPRRSAVRHLSVPAGRPAARPSGDAQWPPRRHRKVTEIAGTAVTFSSQLSHSSQIHECFKCVAISECLGEASA
jgi:hypothetical protein